MSADSEGEADEIQDRRRTPHHAPRDLQAKLRVTVKPLNTLVQPMTEVGKESFSSLIARVNDTIVVRVPLR
jgi:hypothetical protein